MSTNPVPEIPGLSEPLIAAAITPEGTILRYADSGGWHDAAAYAALIVGDADMVPVAPDLDYVLARHRHQYDGDCNYDSGCICGGYKVSGSIDDEAFAAHLAEEIRKALR